MKTFEIRYLKIDEKTFKCNAQNEKGADRQWKKFAKENYIDEWEYEGKRGNWVEIKE